ncbi:hypothetical protein [Brevundimonas lenta]|uniref:DUF3617 family protein n=1 Tax=Brevundimonas lenta TaxID=424796 RepID=A0A7W6JCI0_9CAUL|nr:hypothetical protein [Brevundimonas lenta]MBB4082537.1 hypothetical protein [Brevundimonas lenta]
MRSLAVVTACLGAPLLGLLPAWQAVEQVQSIPLRRGYYVASDTGCDEASRATVMLFKGDGFGLNCETVSIERLSPTRYRLNDRCSDDRGGEGTTDSSTVYEVSSDMAFTIRGDDGSAYSARFCRQQQMPEPFSTNDISDIVKAPAPTP